MDKIFEAIGDAIHDFFVDACGGMFVGIFDDANASVANVSKDVALTPAEWNKRLLSYIFFRCLDFSYKLFPHMKKERHSVMIFLILLQ